MTRALSDDLFVSDTKSADANGRAEIRLQPLRAFQWWRVNRMTVHSTSSVKVPTVKVYRDAEMPSRMVDNSQNGTLDHSDTNMRLNNSEALVFVFEGADVGSSCTAVIEGESSGR